jgi:hypothetical protein
LRSIINSCHTPVGGWIAVTCDIGHHVCGGGCTAGGGDRAGVGRGV